MGLFDACNCPFGDFGRHRYDCAAYADDPPTPERGWGRYGNPATRTEPPLGKAAWPELANTDVPDPDEEDRTA